MWHLARVVGWSLVVNAGIFCVAALINRQNEDWFYDNLDNEVTNGAEAITLLLFTMAAALLITGTALIGTAAFRSDDQRTET